MIQVILLDIEGTTTPIDFVHKTLFPFAKAKIGDYVRENFSEIQIEIEQLKNERETDIEHKGIFDETSPESIVDYLKFLIDIDRKSTALKSLQGKIWRKGYESGELVSEVFADVPPAFERWKSKGQTIAVYSSGSVLAQKLLFRHTHRGDLTPFISDYFDTRVGHKREAESYRKIASALSFPPVENFLFISDIEAELDAAQAAGMQTLISAREGNAALNGESKHRIIYSFDEAV